MPEIIDEFAFTLTQAPAILALTIKRLNPLEEAIAVRPGATVVFAARATTQLGSDVSSSISWALHLGGLSGQVILFWQGKTFPPAIEQEGVYTVRASVSDPTTGESAMVAWSLVVVASAPPLPVPTRLTLTRIEPPTEQLSIFLDDNPPFRAQALRDGVDISGTNIDWWLPFDLHPATGATFTLFDGWYLLGTHPIFATIFDEVSGEGASISWTVTVEEAALPVLAIERVSPLEPVITAFLGDRVAFRAQATVDGADVSSSIDWSLELGGLPERTGVGATFLPTFDRTGVWTLFASITHVPSGGTAEVEWTIDVEDEPPVVGLTIEARSPLPLSLERPLGTREPFRALAILDEADISSSITWSLEFEGVELSTGAGATFLPTFDIVGAWTLTASIQDPGDLDVVASITWEIIVT